MVFIQWQVLLLHVEDYFESVVWKKLLNRAMFCTNYQTGVTMLIMRLPQVSAVTGLPRSTLYLYMSRNQFPKPIKLGVRSVGWVKAEIDDWLMRRMELRKE